MMMMGSGSCDRGTGWAMGQCMGLEYRRTQGMDAEIGNWGMKGNCREMGAQGCGTQGRNAQDGHGCT